jgi:hypothetical protein
MVKPLKDVILVLFDLFDMSDDAFPLSFIYQYVLQKGNDPYISLGFVEMALDHLVCNGSIVKINTNPPLFHRFIENDQTGLTE